MTSNPSFAPTVGSSVAAATQPYPPPASSTSASPSPCAACKFLRRKCHPECVFAPYFLADQPQKFISVHRVFGASNVTKLLREIPAGDREDAVNSLAYEAEMRIRDPVYGCVGVISILHHELRKLQLELSFARAELARYQTGAAGHPADVAANHGSLWGNGSFDMGVVGGGGLMGGAPAAPTGFGLLGGHFYRPSAAGGEEKPGFGLGPA
ncbi:LOB domain-containing protein 6 [Platanthera guangdongensis]|uniref:LOB domain-containing protein 6 n=1 Tax=Platanthera guangdongensis TaxID=2320717 RepID=A0ABR2LHC5_9ASPA